MALELDHPRVQELHGFLGRQRLWPKLNHVDTSYLYSDFIRFVADSLGERPIKLATLSSTTDDSSASLQATIFMDGLMAQCNVKIAAVDGTGGMGEFTEFSGIRFTPWSSIKSVSRMPLLRSGMDMSSAVDFEIEVPEQTVEVCSTKHNDRQLATQLYYELLEYLANRR